MVVKRIGLHILTTSPVSSRFQPPTHCKDFNRSSSNCGYISNRYSFCSFMYILQNKKEGRKPVVGVWRLKEKKKTAHERACPQKLETHIARWHPGSVVHVSPVLRRPSAGQGKGQYSQQQTPQKQGVVCRECVDTTVKKNYCSATKKQSRNRTKKSQEQPPLLLCQWTHPFFCQGQASTRGSADPARLPRYAHRMVLERNLPPIAR